MNVLMGDVLSRPPLAALKSWVAPHNIEII